MTKINRISIHGFKSFANKIEIPFENKFNVVLGPNGAGKSNVGDAICFVLGRLSAKSMRAEKASNLIFNGGKAKKPASSAAVEIAFDNSQKIFPHQDPEVIINRAINKDGSSTYRINGKKMTRTEVLEMLSAARINPDGHNIVLQGDIMRFVDMSHLDRRKIIEEISDVTLYEEKKHKALLELQHVDEKLNNAEIILKERKVYLQELKKDRDQALKFKEFKDHVDSNRATLVHLQLQEKEELKTKYDAELRKHQDKISGAEKEIESLKQKVLQSKQKIADINKEIEQKGEKEQVKVHKDIEDLKVALARDKTRISTLKDEINKIQQRKDQFQHEIKELEEKTESQGRQQKELQQSIKSKQKELQDAERQIAEFKKKNKIETSQDLDKELEEKDKLIEQKQEEVQRIRQQQQDFLREKDKLEYQLQTLDERIRKVKEVEQDNKQQVQELQQKKNDFKSATLKLNQCLDQDSSFASQLGMARKRAVELQEKQAQLNAKSMTLQAGLSNNQALKAILDNKKKFSGVHSTIAELGQVDKKYALALESTAGNRMQHLVVDNDATAAECIKYLKAQKLGTASFIPLNKIHGKDISAENQALLKQSGVHDFAIKVISFKPQFKKAFEYVFSDTLIVDDIDTARKVGIGKLKMAALDGSLAEASGVMRGGFIQRKSNSVGFMEKDSLEELEKAEKELTAQEGILASIQLKREANEKEIFALRNRRAELEADCIKLEKSLHLEDADLNATAELRKELTVQLKSVNDALAKVQQSVNTINRELAELKSKKQTLRSEVSELRNPRLLAQLTAFEELRQKGREELVRYEGDLKNSVAHLEQMFAPEREKIKEILKQHEKEEVQFTLEIKDLSDKTKTAEKELGEKEKASKEFYSRYREAFAQREKCSADISKMENEIDNVREKSRTNEREVNLVSLKNAEIKAKLAALQEELGRYKNKDVEIFKNKSAAELQQEINKFEVMLGQMSAVNMKALEVYEQVEQEYGKLMEKKEGLEKEKTDVMTLMNEIETKKKDHFMKTFNQVSANFERIFSSLFTKGKAYMQLDNENKPFEDGLSVKVRLTGNRFLDIKALSGGEKTLTALAFIFAIQEYQPASFYVLDEIDAALDKHNSETLSKLVRSYADHAQYILISHNDAVISEADTLFGVSMQDGVSKVTSLKV